MMFLLFLFILQAILKMRLDCSVLFRPLNFLSFSDFFAKYVADFALLFATRYSSLLFMSSFHSFQSLHFSFIALTLSSHHQVLLHLGAPFVQPQVLPQALWRQDLICSQQSFTFSPLTFVKDSWTYWLYSSLASGLFSFHICLIGI